MSQVTQTRDQTNADRETVLIVHDVDRDGLGSAAMLVHRFGPDSVRVVPWAEKDRVLSAIRGATENAADGKHIKRIFVLDIPLPASFSGYETLGNEVVWVDHHPAQQTHCKPDNITIIHETGGKQGITTMHLVRQRSFVDGRKTEHFWKALCGVTTPTAWCFAFDGFKAVWPEIPFDVVDLPRYLHMAVTNETVPDEIQCLVTKGVENWTTVSQDIGRLAKLDGPLAVLRLGDAKGIPLAVWSMGLQKKYPEKTSVIVHRNRRLYCGRASRVNGIDLLSFFRTHGLEAAGHSYVCTVAIKGSAADELITALKEAVRQ